MGRPISQEERAAIHWTLSDAFVDNDVNYAVIARDTADYDRDAIKHILYAEVAPVCHTNLETVIPPIWSCFDPNTLESQIQAMLEKRQRSRFRRHLGNLHIRWLTFRYAYLWREIARYYP